MVIVHGILMGFYGDFNGINGTYPLVNVYKKRTWSHGPVEIVDLPIENACMVIFPSVFRMFTRPGRGKGLVSLISQGSAESHHFPPVHWGISWSLGTMRFSCLSQYIIYPLCPLWISQKYPKIFHVIRDSWISQYFPIIYPMYTPFMSLMGMNQPSTHQLF